MGRNSLIVGSHYLHSVEKDYANIVNAISKFVEPTPPTNSITNETIMTQYSIKQGLKVFVKNGKAALKKYLQKFHDRSIVGTKNPQDLRYKKLGKSLE